MKKIVVEVVADDIEKAKCLLRWIVKDFIDRDVTSMSRAFGSASVTVSDSDINHGCFIEESEKAIVIHEDCLLQTCTIAKGLKRKEDCEYWRPVNEK